MEGNVFFKPEDQWDRDEINAGRDGVLENLALFDKAFEGDYFLGDLSAVDFSLYPFLAILVRIEKKTDVGITAELSSDLGAWKKRVEALPFFDKTFPPHWK